MEAISTLPVVKILHRVVRAVVAVVHLDRPRASAGVDVPGQMPEPGCPVRRAW